MTREKTASNIFIGLGSNLENPRSQVETALHELDQIQKTKMIKASSLYRSDPVGPAGQPDYINAVALLETHLTPEQLLDELQAIEQKHQRKRLVHWGPRTLDLDIILIDQQIINTERLTVPHPYAHERNFVIWPLAEIAPDLIFPDDRSINDLLISCSLGTLEKI